MLLYEKDLAGMLSVIVDAGQCSAEKEGTSIEIPERDIFHHTEIGYSIVCRSGNWHLAYEQVPHTFGSMTDTRDGKTYKTVTIDLDGENADLDGRKLELQWCGIWHGKDVSRTNRKTAIFYGRLA